MKMDVETIRESLVRIRDLLNEACAHPTGTPTLSTEKWVELADLFGEADQWVQLCGDFWREYHDDSRPGV